MESFESELISFSFVPNTSELRSPMILEQILNSSYAMKSMGNCEESTGLRVAESVGFGLGFALISALGLFGNLLVILAISTARKMRTTMNFLLLNLAIADIGNLLACIPEMFQILVNEAKWFLPYGICPTIRYCQEAFLYASVATQVAVGFERYSAIRHPLKTKIYCSKAVLGVSTGLIWAISCAFAMPYSWHQVSTLSNLSCPVQLCMPPESSEGFFLQDGSFKTAEFLTFYLVPLLLLLTLYTSVIRKLSEHCGPDVIRNSRMEVTRLEKRRVVKMLLVCMAIYFVGYSPIQIFFLVNKLGLKYYPGTRVILVFNALTFSCSAVNPLIYTIFSTKFRTQFRLLLTCSCKENKFSGALQLLLGRLATTNVVLTTTNLRSHRGSNPPALLQLNMLRGNDAYEPMTDCETPSNC